MGDAAEIERGLAGAQSRLLETVAAGMPVVLWFEHDVHCQLELLQVLTVLPVRISLRSS